MVFKRPSRLELKSADSVSVGRRNSAPGQSVMLPGAHETLKMV